MILNKRETETSETKSEQEHDYHMVSRSLGSQSDHDFRHARCHWRALTFQYALYILRKQQLHFSNNFNSFLFQFKNRAVRDILS